MESITTQPTIDEQLRELAVKRTVACELANRLSKAAAAALAEAEGYAEQEQQLLRQSGQGKRTSIDDSAIAWLSSIMKVDHFDITSESRTQHLTHQRQRMMYILREETGLSFPAIGELFGGRDHSTVIHAHNLITARCAHDPLYAASMMRLRNQFKAEFINRHNN